MKYRVILGVVYPTTVEAESEEEAIELAMDECPYDNADEDRCELCGTTFELRYYRNRLLCTECAKAEKERESIDED